MQMGLVSWFGYKEKEIQSHHLVVRPFKLNESNPDFRLATLNSFSQSS